MKDYEVGFGRPPRKNQFKPGQSGNPKGRKKGCLTFKQDFNEELSERVLITENGIVFSITKRRLIVKQLINKSVKGDIKAAELTIDLMGKNPPETKTLLKTNKPSTVEEARILVQKILKGE